MNQRHAIYALVLSIVLCGLAHVVLKSGMTVNGTLIERALSFRVIGGLCIYAMGTGLWVLSLTKLDLAIAYPISALQYVLIFCGAWWFLDEPISATRIAGTLLIIVGAGVIALDNRRAAQSPAPTS